MENFWQFFSVGLVLFATLLKMRCEGFPLPVFPEGKSKIPPSKVLDFMKQFGYIERGDEASEALYTEEGISETVKMVQKFGAIPETGILDNATLKLISSPRCGVPDIVKRKRSKRFAVASEGWNKRTITYHISNWAPKLGEHTVTKNIQLALDTWGKYGRLRFRRVASPSADIIVAFGKGYHGDRYPFDGPGLVLAHAFFPNEDESGMGGDIHFDAEENWTDDRNNENGIDFLTVAIHELGHSLGLGHSSTPESIMFPYYKGFEPNKDPQLEYDDILGMYELYIRRRLADDDGYTSSENEHSTTTAKSTSQHTTKLYQFSTPTSTSHWTTEFPRFTTPRYNGTSTIRYHGDDESVDDHIRHDPRRRTGSTNSPSLPNICNGYFDAVATLREELFIFKDQYIWRLTERSRIARGYPVTLQQMFPDLPTNVKQVDAAYERPDGNIVIFTGNKFWVYDGRRFVENSPRPLTAYGLPAVLGKIDAVQIWGRNGKTYFYVQDRFWRYNETTKMMDLGYPRHMDKWKGVPQNLDAATTWKDGITYFFKDDRFWKFDNNWVTATEESPLPSPQLWLGCSEDAHNMIRFRD